MIVESITLRILLSERIGRGEAASVASQLRNDDVRGVLCVSYPPLQIMLASRRIWRS